LNSPKLKVKIKNNGVDTYIFMAFILKKKLKNSLRNLMLISKNEISSSFVGNKIF
jgi:hypothetical protein